ncbi:MAG: hypothetical protein ACXAB6_08795, partial [Candidatus Thorarchaeota archaeon]
MPKHLEDQYNGVRLIQRDVTILEELERIIGETIPLLDDDEPVTFGFKAKEHKVIALGLFDKELYSFPECVYDLL